MSFSNSRTMSHIEWIKKDSLIANVPCDILSYLDLFGDLRALIVDAQRRKIDKGFTVFLSLILAVPQDLVTTTRRLTVEK